MVFDESSLYLFTLSLIQICFVTTVVNMIERKVIELHISFILTYTMYYVFQFCKGSPDMRMFPIYPGSVVDENTGLPVRGG